MPLNLKITAEITVDLFRQLTEMDEKSFQILLAKIPEIVEIRKQRMVRKPTREEIARTVT